MFSMLLYSFQVLEGFDQLLNEDLPDLIVDCPLAPELVGKFMARGCADLALDKAALGALVARKDKFKNAYAQLVLVL